MVKTIKERNPNKDSDFYKMFLSIELLRIYFGNEWVNIVIFNKNLEGYEKHFEARNFLRSAQIGFQWQERVRRLAERLYNLQNVKNMDKIIEKIKQGEFSSRFAEIEAATHFHRCRILFEFVNPIGKKGRDFDIKILTNPPINCDVKHKLENIYRDDKIIIKSIKKTLRKARNQVPFNKFSLFLIKIPENWNKKSSLIVNVLNEFLEEKESKKVIAVILRWEERDSNYNGAFYWKFFLQKNKSFKANKKVDKILELLNKPSYKDWINFDYII